MATKNRIGIRCLDPYVPNEIWDLFKKDLRKLFSVAYPERKFSITEFYWTGFSVTEEYIRITPKSEGFVDWEKVWDVLNFVAHEFGMKIRFIYQEKPSFEPKREDDLFERVYASYSLENTRTWTTEQLDEFLENYSFEKIKARYQESL